MSAGQGSPSDIIKKRNGGKVEVFPSGTELLLESGASLDVESGGSLKLAGNEAYTALEALRSTGLSAAELAYLDGATAAITASKAVVADSSGRIAGTAVIVKSTNPLTLMLGDVDGLQLDNAAISGFAAAAATAGNTVYGETEDGGTAAADTDGVNGAGFHFKSGDGSAGGAHTSNDPDGGDGGPISWETGAGGAAGSGGSGVTGVQPPIALRGPVCQKMTIEAAVDDTATVTAAQLLKRLFHSIPTGAATFTLPTAALLVAAMPGAAVGDSFQFFINNASAGANTITVGAGSGGTADGTLTVAQNVARAFVLTLTNVTPASEAYDVWGLGA